jgi:hypothetical protein
LVVGGSAQQQQQTAAPPGVSRRKAGSPPGKEAERVATHRDAPADRQRHQYFRLSNLNLGNLAAIYQLHLHWLAAWTSSYAPSSLSLSLCVDLNLYPEVSNFLLPAPLYL